MSVSGSPLTARRGKEVVVHWTGKPPMRLDDGWIEPTVKKARITITLEKEPVTVMLPKAVRKPRASAAGKAPSKAKNGAKAKPRKRG